MKILYIHPYAFWANSHLLLNFLRISNYLNSKQQELKIPIEENYIDLRHENLPKFIPKMIDHYRIALKKLLNEIYNEFPFDLVAISCYTSFNYLNSVEVAFLIKRNFPKTIIVIGGVHPTIVPDDFQIGNIPRVFFNEYSKNETPFDFLIREEGEIPFFKLIKGLSEKTINSRINMNQPCIVLKSEMVMNLDEIPLINFNLYKKYSDSINKLYIDFSRGCIFRCNYCGTSGTTQCYKKVRIKSVERCINEIEIIKNSPWISIDQIHITDMFFLPKRSKREMFFKELKKLKRKYPKKSLKIIIYDRIEFCTLQNLQNYKELDIIPHFGLDFSSESMLFKMGKFHGKDRDTIDRSIKKYLKKTRELIIESNRINSKIIFYYMIGTPGEDHSTLEQGKDFFLEKRYDSQSLVEKFNVNLDFSKYMAFIGSQLYNNAEEKFGSRIFYKNWWKLFDENQHIYGLLVRPSKDMSLITCLDISYNYMREIIKYQINRKNNFYSFHLILFWKSILNTILELKEKLN
ncbi:MAG: cobalamin-dependent protein [Candidatus Lokiarchaeota archaeon]|nr:cobalamin-dependent protein [Candidatus Lokiarchaeota archaeon]